MTKLYLFNPRISTIANEDVCYPDVSYVYQAITLSADRINRLQSFGKALKAACKNNAQEIWQLLQRFKEQSEEVRIVMRVLYYIGFLSEEHFETLRDTFKSLFPQNPENQRHYSYYGREQRCLHNTSSRFICQNEVRIIVSAFLLDIRNKNKKKALLQFWLKQLVLVDTHTVLYDCHICLTSIFVESFLVCKARAFRSPIHGIGMQLTESVPQGTLLSVGHPLPCTLMRLTGLVNVVARIPRRNRGLFGVAYSINSAANASVESSWIQVYVGHYNSTPLQNIVSEHKPRKEELMELVAFVAVVTLHIHGALELCWTYDLAEEN